MPCHRNAWGGNQTPAMRYQNDSKTESGKLQIYPANFRFPFAAMHGKSISR
jgi:hypothetical protein